MTPSAPPRALFERLPRLADLVPFVELADGLPTPVEQIADRLWVQRDDRTSTTYGGNKVRKLEFVLPVAARRGGPVVTAGGTGSHHVVAAVVHAGRLGLTVEAVQYPQPETADVARTRTRLAAASDTVVSRIPSPYLMPLAIAGKLAGLAPRRPYLLWPGASTPLGSLGHVSAGLELVAAFAASGWPAPDEVVVALGSGGTAVGLALGVALGGWDCTTVVGVRVADPIANNRFVLTALAAATSALLAVGGVAPPRPRLRIDGRWFGEGYGHPIPAGESATARAAELGLALEPTYTAKAFAAALDRSRQASVVFVQTYAG